MDGLGDLFGAVGEFFGGISEAAEGGIEMAAAASAASGERGDESVTATYDRTLAGRRRVLNINDL